MRELTPPPTKKDKFRFDRMGNREPLKVLEQGS